jgi:O-antigen ligase/Tfp pilus assembly protein PilF
MKKYLIEENNICNNLLTIFLKLLLIIVPLLVNKYVYNFRVNQETGLKLFTLISISIWLMKIINTGKYSLKKTKLDLPIILFSLVLIFSLFISQTKMVSLQDFIIFLSYILIFFLITNNLDKKADFNSFIHLFFIISFLVSIYTIIQYYGLDPYLSDLHSLTSTIGQKNWISNYLAMIFPVVFPYFLLEQTKKNKILYFLLLSILYATLMICQSRGIWISIFFTLILAIYIIFKFKLFKIFQENKRWLILLLISFLIITVIYSTDNPLNKSAITVPQRALSTFDEQDPSINTRLLMWKTTFEMIKDRPIFGSGIGTFKMNYLDYQADFLQKNPDYIKYSGKAGEAHNEYLQMWSELGIIGLGIFLLIIFVFYKLVWEFLKQEKDNKKKLTCLGLFLGINCFLIHSLFTFPLHVPTLGSTFFIIFGLTVVYIKDFNLSKIEKEINIKNPLIKKVLNILVLLLMIVAINCMVMKPFIAELYYFKGTRYNVDKNFTKSLPNFQYAVQLDPYNGRIMHALGSTYYHLDIQDEAQNILQKTKKYITDRNTFRNLGLSYTQSGNYQEAEKEFKHAIYLDPKFTKAYVDLAYLYAIQEDYDKAIIEWNKVLEIDPNFPENYNVLYFIGMAYQKKEMPDKALKYFLQALQLAPEGSPIIEEIEKEIYNIYKSHLEN